MSLEFFSLCLFVGVLSCLYVLLPWLEAPEVKLSNSARNFLNRYQSCVQDREILMENLKDLELDFRTQKMQPEDYQLLRERLLNAAVEQTEALKELEANQEFFKWIEAQGQNRVSS